ncbi:aldo/keto reductase [Cerasicoccus maritimus]|uniref:aldo/keto reductase n=1 Tax=Cerasicoccus maritimus TaxID=490089 RepID=UPI002852C925|nr:aldo/keto reductase [Cerasicoccus maritimus]
MTRLTLVFKGDVAYAGGMTTLASLSSSDTKVFNWGVIGPGNIARKFAAGLDDTDTGVLYAAASRDKARAQKFLDEFGGGQAYDSYQALLDDPTVDAVYIATPHPMHAEWAIKAARAGKHVLCEKPVTLNYGDALAVVDAAAEAGVVFLEAFMYRCHPATAKLYELVQSGAIGQVQRMRVSFAFDCGENLKSRLQANELGGGGILDVGCYPVSMCRLLAGAAHGERFLEPKELKAVGRLDPKTGVDVWTSAVMLFEGDIVAEAFTAVRANAENELFVQGTEGTIHVKDFWFCREPITLQRKGQQPEVFEPLVERHLYTYEIEALHQLAHGGGLLNCAMSVEDTLGNMQALDRWRQEIGLVYQMEKPGPKFPCVYGTGWARGCEIPSAEMPGVAKPMARLCMGHPNTQRLFTDCVSLFDAYFERGGNVFDDGSIYRGWATKPSFAGRWMTMRGVREECVIIDKGAHTPNCTPDYMPDEIDRLLKTNYCGYIDLYLMHRDNLDVPVGEFVDLLNAQIDAGKIHAYGLSNWTPERYDEAAAYAQAKGVRGPVCLSNQLSLAEMVNPVWPGTESCSNAERQAWLAERNVPLVAWSSQAAGFFTEQSAPDKKDNGLLVKGYYSDRNFERKKRAYQLAEKKGVLPINLAMAWVLSQPFPTFPIIGPRTITELRTSLEGLRIALTEDERRWLDPATSCYL